MRGRYRIKVSNQKVHFNFEVVRNITVIRGDSGTGKTTLVGMLSDYETLGKQSGVTVACDKPCRVLTGNDWELRLSNMKDSIVFIDEGNKFIKSEDFARAVRSSDNYYVLITRENLYNLPYSVEEIYEMYSFRHNKKLGRVYNGTRRFYSDIPTKSNRLADADMIIAEDSNAGYAFFRHAASKAGVACISAQGKTKIFNLLAGMDQKVLVVADGAAFGAEIDKIHRLQVTNPGKIVLYLPESFEWLILKSDILRMQEIKDILEAPENSIDSSLYFSWEQYFTDLLCDRTRGTYMQYTKSQLSPFYLQDQNVQKIVDEIEK